MSFSFVETEIPGLLIVNSHYHEDIRGNNWKTFQKEIFEERGLECEFGETMITTNQKRGTIRGFHFQLPPYAQTRLNYCISGGWSNYSLDIRKKSPTYGKCICIQMDENDRKGIYIPIGIANLHLILKDNTKVLYQLTSSYMPTYESGVRWDSVSLDFGNISPIISDRDMALSKFGDFDSPFVFGENC